MGQGMGRLRALPGRNRGLNRRSSCGASFRTSCPGVHKVRYFGWLHPRARKRYHRAALLVEARIGLTASTEPEPLQRKEQRRYTPGSIRIATAARAGLRRG